MYERFTDRARKVMQLAAQEAHRLNHEYVGTEHVLLGLAKEGVGVAGNVLRNLGVDLRKIRDQVEKIVQPGPEGEMVTLGRLPLAPRARQVVDAALKEAGALGHTYVGTEHLLLGALRVEEGVAAQVLIGCGVTLAAARAAVLELVGPRAAAPGAAPAEPPPPPDVGAMAAMLKERPGASPMRAWEITYELARGLPGLIAEAGRLRAEVAKLQAFKDYTHERLTAAGVPENPGGPHTEQGCRVGDRFRVVFEERDRLRAAAELLAAPMWLVWSAYHRAWWGPNRAQYYWDVTAAGRYTLEEAMEISKARGVKRGDGISPPELIQPAPEWVAKRAELLAKLAPATRAA